MPRLRSRARGVQGPVSGVLSSPPRLVSDQRGNVVEVILDYRDYKQYLRILAQHADWESLPSYLQDAVDNFLADEALAEEGEAVPLRHIFSRSANLRR